MGSCNCTEIPSEEKRVSGSDPEGSDSESGSRSNDSDTESKLAVYRSQYRSDSESSGSDSEDGLDCSTLSLYDGSGNRPEFQAMAMKSQTKYWKPGKVIRIRFLGGQWDVRQKVIEYAKIWEDYANIEFRFVDEEPSHIRISFDQSLGCYSSVGTDAMAVKSPKATMNLAVSSRTPREDLKGYVLHEFGHVLGCVHEHSSPAGGIEWDRKEVYAHYKKTQGWSKEDVDHNVLKKYDKQTVTQFSKFDPRSIMIYSIPSKLTKNGFSVSSNSDLSPTDKEFIAKIYPKESIRKREGQTSGQGTGNRQWQGQGQGQGSGTQVLPVPNWVCYCPQCIQGPRLGSGTQESLNWVCNCPQCIQARIWVPSLPVFYSNPATPVYYSPYNSSTTYSTGSWGGNINISNNNGVTYSNNNGVTYSTGSWGGNINISNIAYGGRGGNINISNNNVVVW